MTLNKDGDFFINKPEEDPKSLGEYTLDAEMSEQCNSCANKNMLRSHKKVKYCLSSIVLNNKYDQ